MAIDTAADELAKVNAAIEAVLTGGQDIDRNGFSVRQADLDALYRRKNMLEAKIARAARGGIRVRGATPV